jgi:hypothetical protein
MRASLFFFSTVFALSDPGKKQKRPVRLFCFFLEGRTSLFVVFKELVFLKEGPDSAKPVEEVIELDHSVGCLR